jgi:hypothetical protein
VDVLQLDSKNLSVPPSLLSEPVISQDVGSNLVLGQVFQQDRGYLFNTQQLGRFHTAMASDDSAPPIYQDRIGETKRPHAGSDLANLAF